MVIWRRRGERRIYASCATSHILLLLLLRLQLVHESVHDVYTHRRGRVVVFIDGAPAGILIAVYKHVQESLERGKNSSWLAKAQSKDKLLSLQRVLSVFYLEPWSGIKAFHNLSVVKQAVGPISDGNHSTAAAVDVNAVHVSERQADVCG